MPAPRPRNRRSAPAAQPKWYGVRNAAGTVPTLELFGDIGTSREGDPYWGDEGGAGTFKEFCDALKAIGAVPELRVEIHSCGGSVIDGKGIYSRLLEHPSNKTAFIYGVCASAATYPAMACQKIVIPANSFFLIHNSTGFCMGDADDMQAMADSLEVCDESIAELYAARTGMSVEEVMAIMDEDTWMKGTAAVAMGLADELIDPITIDPAQRIAPANFRNAALDAMPAEARVWFDTRRITNARRFSNPTLPPVNAMTEAELKAAQNKLKADQEAFEKTKNDAAEEAKRIKAEAEAEAEKIRNAAKPPGTAPTEPVKPLTREEINNLITEGNKPLMEELKNIREHGLKNLGGGPPFENGKKPADGGDAAPTNDAELKAALAKCANHNERRAIINAYDKAKKG